MSAHTPGPWCTGSTVDANGDVTHAVFYDTAEADSNYGRPLVLVYGGSDTAKPNAALIAAAPDLLAACETMFEWDKAEKEPFSHEVLSRRIALAGEAFALAGAAIAKARGQ